MVNCQNYGEVSAKLLNFKIYICLVGSLENHLVKLQKYDSEKCEQNLALDRQ